MIRLLLAGLLFAGTANAQPRVLSLGGAVTETVFALGQGAALVGSDQTSLFPPAGGGCMLHAQTTTYYSSTVGTSTRYDLFLSCLVLLLAKRAGVLCLTACGAKVFLILIHKTESRVYSS